MMDLLLEEGNGAPFSIICRICLKAKQGMESVYAATIPHMLMYCVSLKVEHGDGLPNLICSQCLKQINQLFSFKQLCEKSESLLKHYLPLKIIPAQDLTVEDVTQNQILDTLEDPTLTSTSYIPNEPFDEQDLVETDNLVPLAVCLPHCGDSSLFAHDIDLDSERSLYILKDDDFSNNYLDMTENSWTDGGETSSEILVDSKDTPFPDLVSDAGSEQLNHHCEECKDVFIYSEDLAVHMSLHATGGSLKCNFCEKEFHRRESLKRHIRGHMKEKPLCCSLCDKRFTEKSSLKRHLKSHSAWKGNVHMCTECGDTFVDPQELDTHMMLHSEQTPYVCQLCPATFTEKRLYRSHYNTHSDRKKYHCHECGKSFTSAFSLSEHIKLHSETSQHKCDVCGKEFVQMSSLQIHLGSHNPERTFTCVFCTGHTYKRSSSLRDHISKVHPEKVDASQMRKCRDCDQQFLKYGDLIAHRNDQHKDLVFKCDFCDKTFSQKYRKKRHMLSHMKKGGIIEVNGNYILEEKQQSSEVSTTVKKENGDVSQEIIDGNRVEREDDETKVATDYIQDFNSRRFDGGTTSMDMGDRSKMVSPENNPIQGRIIAASQNAEDCQDVKTNIVTQNGDSDMVLSPNPGTQASNGVVTKLNPVVILSDVCVNSVKDKSGGYQCKICYSKVPKFKDLPVHMSLHPVDTSMWQCNVCNKKFNKRTFLSRHIKIHMTRELFPCSRCERKFLEKSKLRKHILKSHTEVSETPPVSSEEEKSQTSTDNIDNTQLLPELMETSTLTENHLEISLNDSCSPDSSQIVSSLTQPSGIIASPMLVDSSIGIVNHLQSSLNNSLINSYLTEHQSVNINPVNPPTLVSCTRITSSNSHLTINSSQAYQMQLTENGIQLVNNQPALVTNQQLPDVNQYSCDVCGKSFGKAIKLSLHMRSHNQSQESEAVYSCEVCNQTFSNEPDLMQHSQTHVDNNATHICQMCGQSFNASSNLAAHMKSKHMIVPFKSVPTCKICAKSFSSMYQRRKHMQLHKVDQTSPQELQELTRC